MYEETGTDNNGNLRMEKLAHTVGTPFSVDRSFGYDAANRLGSFTEPSKSQSFGYDAFGNLWQTAASGVPALRPNGSSWYLLGSGQVNNRLANTAYDEAGHQLQLSLTPGTTASYDAEGRVSRVELNSSPVATYDYDADGRRVKKTVGATTTYYVYSADGQLMAEYGGTPASVGTRYLVADHLGSTRLILDAQGNCAERIDYAPFGAQLTRSGQPCYTSSTSGLPLFTGQIRDGESTAGTDTGLDYFNTRYFWAALGRFSSPDAPGFDQWPVNPQSWNLYSYVRNSPLRFLDRFGRKCVKLDGGGVGDDGTAPVCDDPSIGTTHGITVGAGDVTPVEVGWEWLTGRGPRQRTFTDEDRFTKLLRQHGHIQNVTNAIQQQLGNCQVPSPRSIDRAGTSPNYSLAGVEGVPKYIGDYSTLATGGATGNLAVTYLGSYNLSFNVENVNFAGGTATVSVHVSNVSSFASGTRPPVIGYTTAWQNTVGRALNGAFNSGAMSPTQQDFFWTQQISFSGRACR